MRNNEKLKKFVKEEDIDILLNQVIMDANNLYQTLKERTKLHDKEIRNFDFSFQTNSEKKINKLRDEIQNIFDITNADILFDKDTKTYSIYFEYIKIPVTADNLTFLIVDLFIKGFRQDCLLYGYGIMQSDETIFPKIMTEEENKYIDMAFKQFESTNYSQSIFNLTNAIECNSNNSYSYFLRGTCLQNIYFSKKAIEDFDNALKLDKSKAEIILQNRGAAKDDIGDHKGAIKDYDDAIKLSPNLDSLYVNRGNSKYKLNDFKGAEEDWIKAKKLGSDDVDFRLKMIPK